MFFHFFNFVFLPSHVQDYPCGSKGKAKPIMNTNSVISILSLFGADVSDVQDTKKTTDVDDPNEYVGVDYTTDDKSAPLFILYDHQETCSTLLRACVSLGWAYCARSGNKKVTNFFNAKWIPHLHERNDLTIKQVTLL